MGTGQAHAGPLTALATVLRGGHPPNLSALLMLVEEAETFQDFLRLIDEYLPGRRQDITGQGGPGDMVVAFARAFGERYFPLAHHIQAADIESLRELLDYIPIDVDGYDYDDYDGLSDRDPEVILASLLVDFEGEVGVEEGVRVTLLEAAARHVSRELLGRIPERGYPLEVLEGILPGSLYEGLLEHARHLCHQAGTIFLDCTREELWSDPPDWCRPDVDGLTEDWQRADGMLDRMGDFFRWLDEDLEGNFAQVLAFLGAPCPSKEQMGLPLEFEEEGDGEG